MKIVRWKRFIWELAALPPLTRVPSGNLIFREAAREEVREVRALIHRAFSLDSTWSDAVTLFRDWLETQTDAAFHRDPVPAIVVTHGPRIIAASVLSLEPDAESHLLSGPCVLPEYCSRGVGTALLHHSLRHLRSSGLERAAGVTKENVAAGKFVYPKFGATSAAHDFEPQPVGT